MGRPSPEATAAPLRASLPISDAPRADAPTPAATVRAVVLFGVGLLLATAGVRAVLWSDPEVPVESNRRARLLAHHFAERQDELDLVFVGSSRFYRGVDPAAFDRRAAELGRPLTSFNWSMNGMRMPEILARADRILERRPERLRWLVLELTTLDPSYREDNRLGRRMIAWHTARATRDVLSVLARSDRSAGELVRDARPHLLELGARWSSLGLGPVALARWIGAAPPGPRWPGFDGFEDEAEEEARQRGLLDVGGPVVEAEPDLGPDPEPGEGEDRGAGRAEAAPEPLRDGFPPAQREVLAAFVARARARGVEPVFVRAPRSTPDRTARLALEAGTIDVLLAYDDPRRHPELHAPALRRDRGHLSSDGARVFSERLAEDFLERVAARDRR